jgi:competence protein ComEC
VPGGNMIKPVVYYCISIVMGCITALLFLNNYYIGAALIAASFLVCILFTVSDYKFFIIIFMFQVLGFAAYTSYFTYTGFVNNNISIRIKEQASYQLIGEFKGKLLVLRGNTKELQVGQLIYANGYFTKDSRFDTGTIGTYYIKDVKIENQSFLYKMVKFRNYVYTKLQNKLGTENSAIVAAASFGDTTHVKKEDTDKFNRLGILHVVSVSGFHLAIIYKFAELLGGMYTAIPLALLYTIFTGSQGSTLRSFIMILVMKLSGRVYKNYDPYSSLALSAVILIIYKPYYITDIGFILSYLSMLGIFITYSKIKSKLIFLPEKINEAISMAVSAQFLSAPFIIAVMNQFSFGFIPGNVFLLPLYSVLVILGNISLAFVKFDFIFNICTNILNIILTAIEGGSDLILKICPPIAYMKYNYVIYILLIYMSYLLFKRVNKVCIYIPIIIFPLIFMESYKFFPEIQYMSSSRINCIVVRYKFERLIIASDAHKAIINNKKLMEENGISKVYIYNEFNNRVNLDTKLMIGIKENESSGKFPDLLIANRGSLKLLTNDQANKVIAQNSKYDIIYVETSLPNRNRKILQTVILISNKYRLVY